MTPVQILRAYNAWRRDDTGELSTLDELGITPRMIGEALDTVLNLVEQQGAQMARDSAELRNLCAARDRARKERGEALQELAELKAKEMRR